MRWFHGTSEKNAERILREGVLKPGQDTIYREDQPRRDAVYVTADYEIAKHYAEEGGRGGVVLEVVVDPKKLIPDEDDVFELLEEKPANLNPQAQKQQARLRQLWLAYWNADNPEPQEFNEAWESYNEVAEDWYASMSGELAEHMKGLTDYVVAHDPALAAGIVATHEKGAHVGAVKVRGIAKMAAKKPEYIKTPGFVIEVPKDRRKGFFVAPKAPLVYWAFKNRPRVFISEKLVFTFNGKPVAEALVAKVEGPGKGEGEYQKWHKVYWKPVTFRRFRVAAEDVLYHVTLQKNVDDILENGLKAEHGYQFFDDVPKSTYLTEKRGLPFWKDEIASYYGDPQVVLQVNRKGLNLIPDEFGTHDAGAPAYRVEHDIPPDRIKLASVTKTADHDLETDSGETYWAGTGNAASGILPVCPQKGTVCLAWRSQYVQSPDCWGTIGGAVQSGKSPQQSAKAELHEETGYSGGIGLTPAYVFTDGGFTYHNYIGVVSSEFSFSPKELSREEYMVLKSKLRPEQYHQLIPGWETDHILWMKYETVLDDMNENPEDYHPGMLKLFKNSKDAIERALGIKKEEPEQPKTAAHSPACKCEMCRSISAWKRPWLMGKCPEFALALSSIMPDAQFVAIGTAMFEHVGMRRGDVYYDVRGTMDKAQFAELFGSNESSVHDVDRELVMKDAYPSYIGHEDELVKLPDFKAALRTVRKVFGGKTAELLPTAQPPDVRILPCPSGKKKYYDKATILMKERGMNGQPPAAYQCPKCHWWHMTSKPQTGPNPTYRRAAEQMHLFPSSQDAKFRQWFDGSKVVDQQGRPMPVYHGTRSSVDFDTFSVDGPPQVEDSYEGETTSSGSGWDPTAFLGSHFAEESRVANQFAQGEGWTKSRYEGEAEAPRVIQVFLRITTPEGFRHREQPAQLHLPRQDHR